MIHWRLATVVAHGCGRSVTSKCAKGKERLDTNLHRLAVRQ